MKWHEVDHTYHGVTVVVNDPNHKEIEKLGSEIVGVVRCPQPECSPVLLIGESQYKGVSKTADVEII